jgi:hypothetical protein
VPKEDHVFRETPFIATLVRELHARRLLALESDDRYPEVTPDSDPLHAVFYLLQEVGELPVRFRFKGSVSPFSSDLESVLDEYNRSREFWGGQAERGTLSEASVAALDKLADVGMDVPQAFVNSPPDYERWWFVLATYLFITRSPLYARGERTEAIADINRLLPKAFAEAELAAVQQRAEALAAA